MSTTESCSNAAESDVSQALGVRVQKSSEGVLEAVLETFNTAEAMFWQERSGYKLEANPILMKAITQEDQWLFDEDSFRIPIKREDKSVLVRHVRSNASQMPFKDLPCILQQGLAEEYEQSCIENGAEPHELSSVRLTEWNAVQPKLDYNTGGWFAWHYVNAPHQTVILALGENSSRNDHPVPSDKPKSEDAEVNTFAASSDFAVKGSIKAENVSVASNESAT